MLGLGSLAPTAKMPAETPALPVAAVLAVWLLLTLLAKEDIGSFRRKYPAVGVMNTKHQDILKSFQALIDSAEATLRTCDTSLTGEPQPRDDEYFSFRTQALNLVQRVCGERSNHYQALQRIASEDESKNDSCFFPHCLGVVQAAKKDFEQGLLFDLRSIIAAELLVSFIDHAERSLSAKDLRAAVAVGGAVLEEVLRRISEANELAPPTPATIESLSAALAAAGVYTALVHKRVSGIAALARTEALRPDDVEDMIAWVRKFAADQLG